MTIIFLDPAPDAPDGFDLMSQYQMIPAGGVRAMALWVQSDEPEDIIVYCADPNKAYVYGLYVVQGHAAIQGSGYFVKRDSAIRFFIGGRDPGPTTMNVETVSGKGRTFLLLSVKQPLYLTYQLGVLSDPVHVPAKEIVGPNLANNTRGAEKIWLDQANVVLTRVGAINDVVAPMDLHDPIEIDDQVVRAVWTASQTPQLVAADVYIYGTWNLSIWGNPWYSGATLGRMCFVENQFSGRMGRLVCAHEIGHALGLVHNQDDRPIFLMDGFRAGGEFLDMWEIETVNRGYGQGTL